MKIWSRLSLDERKLIDGFREGEFYVLQRAYSQIRRKYYAFGIIPLGKEVASGDREKLKDLSDKLAVFHTYYSSRNPEKDYLNSRVIGMRFEIKKMLVKA